MDAALPQWGHRVHRRVGIFFRSYPDIGTPDVVTDDRAYPYDDGSIMGVDLTGGTTLGMTFGIEGSSEAEARDRYDVLRQLWRGDEVRRTVGAVAELRSDRGRSALGRPRRIAPSQWRLDHTPPGLDVVADFQTVDDLWYGDTKSVTATLGYRAVGGIRFPVKFPLTTSPESDRSQTFIVSGDVPTWGMYEITGPVLSPWLEVPGVARYSFTGLRLAYDQWLTIDTRPWAREVYRNDGAPLGGALDTSSTLLSGNPLPPGQHKLLLRGTTTGTPRASATWRDAFTTP
ncbi:hypothetical protein P9139_18135 [Curtobacterium flaccumfaciens]|nr:hypothetical protein P9139_18135 [Curtobacterium flaccumfaciens]